MSTFASGLTFADQVPLSGESTGFELVPGDGSVNFPVVANAISAGEVTAAYNPSNGDIMVEIGGDQAVESGVLVVGFQSSEGLLQTDFTVDSSRADGSLPAPSETPSGSTGEKLAYFSFQSLPSGIHTFTGLLPANLLFSSPEAFSTPADDNATQNRITLPDSSSGGTISLTFSGPGVGRVAALSVAAIPEPTGTLLLAGLGLTFLKRKRSATFG